MCARHLWREGKVLWNRLVRWFFVGIAVDHVSVAAVLFSFSRAQCLFVASATCQCVFACVCGWGEGGSAMGCDGMGLHWCLFECLSLRSPVSLLLSSNPSPPLVCPSLVTGCIFVHSSYSVYPFLSLTLSPPSMLGEGVGDHCCNVFQINHQKNGTVLNERSIENIDVHPAPPTTVCHGHNRV